MQHTPRAHEVREMFGSIAARYDLGNTVLSGGIHWLWRRRLFALLPERPAALGLDLCTGTGDLLLPLERRCDRVIGADFCLPMLQHGQPRLRSRRSPTVLLQADALQLPFRDQTFDLISIAFGVRNFADPLRGLVEVRRVLKARGLLLVLEFGQPSAGLFGGLYRFYSRRILPVVGGLLTGSRAAYEYLPDTAARFPCAGAFEELLQQAGLRPLKTVRLTGGIAFGYLAERPGA